MFLKNVVNKNYNVNKYEKEIRNVVGNDSFLKGKRYNTNYVEYLDTISSGYNKKNHAFEVESESYYTDYDVSIETINGVVKEVYCSCPQFRTYHTCKHVAACLINYSSIIFAVPESPLKITKNFLSKYYKQQTDGNSIKEELKLELELTIAKKSSFRIKVGLNKTYVLSTYRKFNDFLYAIKNKSTFFFGVNFTYDYNKQYFNDIDTKILDFLSNINKSYYYSNDIFTLDERDLSSLLNILENKTFTITSYGIVNNIVKSLPTQLQLDLKDDVYYLSLLNFEKYKLIDNEYKYIYYDKKLFIIPFEYRDIMAVYYQNSLAELEFTKEEKSLFVNGLLKTIKNNIRISSNIDDIIISKEPLASLYFDLKRERIEADIKFDYSGTTVSYFDINDNIVRDNVYEQKTVKELLNYSFEEEKKKIHSR